MKTLRCAVIGVGHLGQYHAEKYTKLPGIELVAVCDTDKTRCDEIAAKLNTRAVYDHTDLLGQVDAVSIVVPTVYHHAVAKDFLSHGVHVLLEKPITKTLAEADDLIQTAKQHKVVFQIGHLERFNSALLALRSHLKQPRFIESHRLAPFKPRCTDVNVILDLMIHDIDIIQTVVQSPIKHLTATGAAVLSPTSDIANARIEFDSGCIANVTASRISFKMERKMRIFQSNLYASVDFQEQQYKIYRKGDGEMFPGIPNIIEDASNFTPNDAIQLETMAFLDAIRENKSPVVTGEDGFMALKTALAITDMIRQSPLLEETYEPA